MTLQDTLKRAIARSEMTMNAIEVASGVSRANLGRFMTGERSITLATADKLLTALKAKVKIELPRRRK